VWADVFALLMRKPSAGSDRRWFLSIFSKEEKDIDISYVRC